MPDPCTCITCPEGIPDYYLVTMSGVTRPAGSACSESDCATNNRSFLCEPFYQCDIFQCEWRFTEASPPGCQFDDVRVIPLPSYPPYTMEVLLDGPLSSGPLSYRKSNLLSCLS